MFPPSLYYDNNFLAAGGVSASAEAVNPLSDIMTSSECGPNLLIGSALVEHKISASPPKPDICAFMSTRS
jgi:hypothetical protein